MTIGEYALLVQKTRHAQREYFRAKSSGALDVARAMERTLDAVTLQILEGPGLWPEDVIGARDECKDATA